MFVMVLYGQMIILESTYEVCKEKNSVDLCFLGSIKFTWTYV